MSRRAIRVIKPQYDVSSRTLSVGLAVIKQFRVPAKNQELILRAFQEENWPQHLDDPLPPSPGFVSSARLHDAIKSLNRNQRNKMVHFSGDGTGRGILWSILELPQDRP